MALPPWKSFPVPARTRLQTHPWWICEQRCRKVFKTTLKKQPWEFTYHLPCWCTHSLSLPPTFPFRFGTMGAPLRLEVWVWITEIHQVSFQTSALFYFTGFCSIKPHCLSSAYLLLLRNNRSWLPYFGSCRATALRHEPDCICVCMHASVCA